MTSTSPNINRWLGGAIGIAIASSIAASHTNGLLHVGDAPPSALTGGFTRALWVLGAVALLALPAIFTLIRRNEFSEAAARTAIGDRHPALASAN
jgi:hypothetical protein